MTDLFHSGATWLDAQMRRAKATRCITIADLATAPTVSIEDIEATPTNNAWDEEQTDGSVIRIESRDWIVTAADLIVDDVPKLPKRGWLITDSLDGAVYEVIPQGDAPWEWSDTGKVRIRIHTRALDSDQ